MNKALEEVASTKCNDECENNNNFFDLKSISKNKIFIFIIIIALIACNGGGFSGNNGFVPCGRPSRCGGGGGGGKGSLWGLLVLAFLFAGNGVGGLGNAGVGNVNTNVINLGPEEDCCDEPCDDCC